MSYYDTVRKYRNIDPDKIFGAPPKHAIETAIHADEPSAAQFGHLLSSGASEFLEDMARRSRSVTLRHFGRTVQLYTPLYLSNYCDNACAYCGFNAANNIERKKLTPDEVDKEALSIASTGIRHILALTGGSRKESPVSYIKECVKILNRCFSSISIEVYALAAEEYRELISEGVDGLTIYQETYNEEVYKKMHPAGPKSDYLFRLDASERGAAAGMRSVNIGILFGLSSWRRDIFLMGLNAKYLQDKFPDVEIGVSIPRIRPQTGGFKPAEEVTDKDIAQAVAALRLFMPRASISLSTRETAGFRDNILPLGITRMSAGSTTRVGGHTLEPREGAAAQFQISDERNVAEIMEMLKRKGYQGVLKDWMRL